MDRRPAINDDYEDDASQGADDVYYGAVSMSDAQGFSAGSMSTELREGAKADHSSDDDD